MDMIRTNFGKSFYDDLVLSVKLENLKIQNISCIPDAGC